jgi:hypothetical protein
MGNMIFQFKDNSKWLYGLLLLVVAVISFAALQPRLAKERKDRAVGIVVNHRDVVSMALNTERSPRNVLQELMDKGVTGLMVSELTGEEMALGGVPAAYGAEARMTAGISPTSFELRRHTKRALLPKPSPRRSTRRPSIP